MIEEEYKKFNKEIENLNINKVTNLDKISNEKKVKFITSALPYVNNHPHLGNIVGALLSADVYARFCRLRGYETVFISGTDDYGTAVMMEALKLETTPEKLVTENREIHKKIYEYFGISTDYFGHTYTEEHNELVKEFFLRTQSYFDIKTIVQYYCESKCKQFLADRYVKGICNYCGGSAYADQCEVCTKLLEAKDLKEPKCSICGNEPIFKETEHLFLRLDELVKKLTGENQDFSKWSENAQNIYNDWLQKDIRPRCMTRDMVVKWGVEVPVKGFEGKVFYVWFDAPIGYFTYLLHVVKSLEYLNSDNLEFIQFMGKDNVPFHSIIFPCMVEGLKESLRKDNKLIDSLNNSKTKLSKMIFDNIKRDKGDHQEYFIEEYLSNLRKFENCQFKYKPIISSTEYLTFNGKKFSKSNNVGIFGLDVLNKSIGDISKYRFYLMFKRPETKDSDFSIDDFISSINKHLIGNIGNLVNRTNKYIAKNGFSLLEDQKLDDDDEIIEFISQCNNSYLEFLNLLEERKLRKGLEKILELSSRGNLYLQNLQKVSNSERKLGFSIAFSVVVFVGICLSPYVPEISKKILEQCNFSFKEFPSKFEIIRKCEFNISINPIVKQFTEEELNNLNELNK